jgi:hypothetical protein
MASRFSFGIFGQGSGDLQPDLTIEIKTAGTSTSLASTSNNTITDNGDGTYFCDTLATGKIDVYVAGALQDEMADQMVVTDDVKTHLDNTTKHRLIDDTGTSASALWSASKINTYTNATFEGADSTIMKEGEVDDVTLEYATTLHIKDGGVVEGKLGAFAVTTGKISPTSVTNAKMATNSIGSNQIIDANVTTAKIADGDVTKAKIEDNGIDASKITHHSGYGVIVFGSDGTPSYGPISTGHLDSGVVTESKIGASAVTEEKMADNAIGANEMKHHSDYGAVVFNTAGVPSFGLVDTDHIADLAITSEKLATSVGLTPTDDTIDPNHFKVPATGTAGFSEQAGTDGIGGVIASVPSYASADQFKWLDLKFDGMNVTDSSDASSGKLQKTIKIDQSFTSENYISSDKTLLQNLDILDQRLGYLTQFSGTEGLYTVLACADWDSYRDSASHDTPVYQADPTIEVASMTDGGSYSAGTFYTVKKINFYKVPDYRQLALYIRMRVDNSASGMHGKSQVTVGGYSVSNSSQSTDSITTTNANGEMGAIYFDLTNHANYEIYTVNVQFMFDRSVAGTKKVELLEWCLIAKRQITVVGGITTQYQANPN